MGAPTLHYIHDPLCGWCYAASPLVEAVAEAGIAIMLHGGGLWETATSLSPQKRDLIRRGDARIAAIAGVPFGSRYADGLLTDTATSFWSRPTTAAVLAAGLVQAGADRRMLRAIQQAHYIDGQRVVERPVLAAAAVGIGLAEGTFLDAFDAAPVDNHVADTRRLMGRLGLRGFPGFVLEIGSALARVDHESFYGRSQDFTVRVATIADALAASAGASAPNLMERTNQ